MLYFKPALSFLRFSMAQTEEISTVTLPALFFIKDNYPGSNTVAYMLLSFTILCKWGKPVLPGVTEKASAPGSTSLCFSCHSGFGKYSLSPSQTAKFQIMINVFGSQKDSINIIGRHCRPLGIWSKLMLMHNKYEMIFVFQTGTIYISKDYRQLASFAFLFWTIWHPRMCYIHVLVSLCTLPWDLYPYWWYMKWWMDCPKHLEYHGGKKKSIRPHLSMWLNTWDSSEKGDVSLTIFGAADAMH